MQNIEVAGVPITPLRKLEILALLKRRIMDNKQTLIITPYSEFVFRSLYSDEVQQIFNKANVSISDGIGILIAQNFLVQPFRAKNFIGKLAEAIYQFLGWLFKAVVNRTKLYSTIPEKIPGREFFWDVMRLASDKKMSVFLAGGFGDTPLLVKNEVLKRFPELTIAGFSNLPPQNADLLEMIKNAKAEIVIAAYGPVIQEQWLNQILEQTAVKIGMGVGGTFDYIAGKVTTPPVWINTMGFEWLYRLFTQKKRLKRIYQATWGFMTALIRYKIYESMPYRKNVLLVISWQGKLLICKRKPGKDVRFGTNFLDYWQLPQGGIELNESLESAGLREALEETGLSNLKLKKISEHTHKYKWRNGRRPLIFHLFNDKFRYSGQEQYLLFFEIPDNQTPRVQLDNVEFVEYVWLAPHAAKSVVHPERQEVMDLILKELEIYAK